MKTVEGGQQICEAESTYFFGMCLKWRNCSEVCITEGFVEGRCQGFFRKCICRKPCFVSTYDFNFYIRKNNIYHYFIYNSGFENAHSIYISE